MSNLHDINELHFEEASSNVYIKNWRERFAAPLLITVLILGLFVLIPALFATTSIATKIFYSFAYLFIFAITISPKSLISSLTHNLYTPFQQHYPPSSSLQHLQQHVQVMIQFILFGPQRFYRSHRVDDCSVIPPTKSATNFRIAVSGNFPA